MVKRIIIDKNGCKAPKVVLHGFQIASNNSSKTRILISNIQFHLPGALCQVIDSLSCQFLKKISILLVFYFTVSLSSYITQRKQS